MKNYYDLREELTNNELRLKFLKDKKQLYFNETQPKTILPKDVVVKGATHEDKFFKYITKIEDIDKEIKFLEKEIDMQRKYLHQLEDSLRRMKDTKAKIFVLRYMDNLKVKQIAKITSYSEPHIYTLLGEIKKIIKNNNN